MDSQLDFYTAFIFLQFNGIAVTSTDFYLQSKMMDATVVHIGAWKT
jgi:hypothetical protein